MVEQGTHKPLVGGSNPPSGSFLTPKKRNRFPKSFLNFPLSNSDLFWTDIIEGRPPDLRSFKNLAILRPCKIFIRPFLKSAFKTPSSTAGTFSFVSSSLSFLYSESFISGKRSTSPPEHKFKTMPMEK